MNKKIKTFILATIALPYSYASANESIVNLGVGVSVAPVYEGSKKYQIGPSVEATYAYISDDYGMFSVGLEGLAWGVSLTENLTFFSSFGYDFGRDEEIGLLGNKNKDLKGMGDLDGSPLVGFALSYNLDNYEFYVSTDIATAEREYGGRKVGRAVSVILGANAMYEINENWYIDYNIATVWANESYNQIYFGVTKQQAKKSKFAEYDAGAGFKDVNSSLILNYKVYENMTLYTGVGVYHLVGDAGNSTLTERQTGFTGMTGVSYTF
ncbi:MipA/OmpV family protein [Providencia rettgeri]|uniref:MipA/OmpV family protein n=1 Tax=Providencia TaxID=586 RepID=UPI0022729425|nr:MULTISPECIES: MipA/OmpV family protein [unclassified Providencia]MDB9566935.1 MipA/OmpV family protein [Providencia rettgeri]WOB92583.1 MipA/OmpV family protein [Providencia sp. PROV175]